VRQLFTVLSGLAIAIAFIPFIKGTIQGWVVPNRASWIVWFVQDVLIASSAIMAEVGPAAVMPIIWGLGQQWCDSLTDAKPRRQNDNLPHKAPGEAALTGA